MALPVMAITNASTCLTDLQVSAAIPSLQRQVTLDFRAYWGVDCQLEFLTKDEPLAEGKGRLEEKSAAILATSCASAHPPW